MKKDYKFSPAKIMLDFYKSSSARDGNIELTVKDIASWLEEKTNGEYVVFSREIIAKLIEYALQHEQCYENDFIGKELKLPKEELEYLRDYWL